MRPGRAAGPRAGSPGMRPSGEVGMRAGSAAKQQLAGGAGLGVCLFSLSPPRRGLSRLVALGPHSPLPAPFYVSFSFSCRKGRSQESMPSSSPTRSTGRRRIMNGRCLLLRKSTGVVSAHGALHQSRGNGPSAALHCCKLSHLIDHWEIRCRETWAGRSPRATLGSSERLCRWRQLRFTAPGMEGTAAAKPPGQQQARLHQRSADSRPARRASPAAALG